MDPALEQLLAALPRTSPSAAPRFERSANESCAAWLSQLEQARSAADSSALQHRAAVDAASRALFGTTASELLGEPTQHLTRTAAQVTVPGTAQLADLVGQLPSSVPSGPLPPCPDEIHDQVTVTITAPPHPTAGVVRLHGGAFWMGGGQVARTVDRALVDHIADVANAAVFDVDHRLAPEHPFPAAVIDVLTVLDAVRGGLGAVADGPLALLGTSSGANIATLAARIDSHRAPRPPLAALALIVPSVLLHHASSTMQRDPNAWAHRLDQLRGYLGPRIAPSDPWISPGTLPLIPGMPPTFAATAQYDDVAAGGAGLVAAIAAAGTAVELHTYAMTHTTAPPQVEAQFISDAAQFLKRALPAR